MTIYLGSRYETAAVSTITDANYKTNRVAFRGSSPVVSVSSYTYRLVGVGERLDHIAYENYGRSDYWWVIADANPGVSLGDPLTPGTVLRIPSGRDIR